MKCTDLKYSTNEVQQTQKRLASKCFSGNRTLLSLWKLPSGFLGTSPPPQATTVLIFSYHGLVFRSVLELHRYEVLEHTATYAWPPSLDMMLSRGIRVVRVSCLVGFHCGTGSVDVSAFPLMGYRSRWRLLTVMNQLLWRVSFKSFVDIHFCFC